MNFDHVHRQINIKFEEILSWKHFLIFYFFRLDEIVHSVQASSPVLSDAERQWSQEVDHVQMKVKELRRYIEVVSTPCNQYAPLLINMYSL